MAKTKIKSILRGYPEFVVLGRIRNTVSATARIIPVKTINAILVDSFIRADLHH
ncbi:hypothetical protein HYU95_02120 [Candidatus Daviesbacteria bacterium]|nr:hypothetical protein [Candidatus Daviesbacteria bacterium]